MKNKRILFIVHDASRSGAPVVLLNFLRWFKKNDKIDFDILLLEDGPIRKEFEELTKTFVVPAVFSYTLKNKIRRRLHPELSHYYKVSEVCNKLYKNDYALFFGNTIVTLPWILKFKELTNSKIICAMHELTHVIEYYFEKDYISKELPKIDLILAGSRAVEKNLIDDLKIPKEKIKVIHAFIETNFTVSKTAQKLREELGIKPNEFIIGGMGLVELRKGVDLIVPLAVELKNKYPDLLFKIIWVGGSASHKFIKIFKQDAIKCGVQENVLFIENTPYPNDYINLFDVFVLLSREDPFPMVLLTAAYLEKTLIAFHKSGGASELINDDAGFLASYLDVGDVAKIISRISHHPHIAKETGKIAKQKVIKEYTADVIPAKIAKVLHDHL